MQYWVVMLRGRRTILCLDALELDAEQSAAQQAGGALLARELAKCRAGFSAVSGRRVATGAWGCGAFGGDKDVKFGEVKVIILRVVSYIGLLSAIQVIAASQENVGKLR